MPIIEQVPTELPLSQGDILQGIKLFKTTGSWIAGGETTAPVNKQLSLVISRPCVCEHKPFVTLASIEKYGEPIPKEAETFEDVVAFLTDTRDAPDSPDVFYIGEIAGKTGRFAAKLDSLHCVDMPTDAMERAAFIKDRRIGRLCSEFIRDLHTRIFRAYANLGFDDYGWFSDADLQIVIDKGKVGIHAAELKVLQLKAQQVQKAFSAGQISAKDLTDAEASLQKAKDALAPYEEEFAKRQKK